MNLIKVITAICSLLFFMIGADKFLNFMQPPCSLMDTLSPLAWKVLGVMQIAGGILIWFSKYRQLVASFFLGLMIFFTIYHLMENTYDIGGAVFMAVMLGLLVWNPGFLRGRKT